MGIEEELPRVILLQYSKSQAEMSGFEPVSPAMGVEEALFALCFDAPCCGAELKHVD